ncbi:phosphoserine transaminase [Pontivivens insulae]|uniref:phosphoserine transaminase n=1 Tax=Pontivivens insulae TaxID=1639689 RepID=A0A2R8A9R4_9RHOB|nr:phosphoserine transaminase [Pontivivens insulae]RED12873.1 phosphoserine aminotransferase [Pontivivens insulae]SPF28964.1 Phosphoserine aminotransferase [Pontivivens insulae]
MSLPQTPQVKPARPEFSSGPCPKRPGWSAEAVASRYFAGRSHRAAGPKAQIADVITKMADLLDVPVGYRVGIVPASDTGAYEMAMWSMLGARPVDMLVWESFGKGWATDATKQLKLDDCHVIEAAYGELPDFTQVRMDADICFTQNGTTSGARIPNFDWIAADREGLTFVDATSAVFAQPVDWAKVDVLTFSWQKVLGGEGAHGVLILSPRAVERLESYTPDRPLPKIFRMTKGGKLIEGIFTGATINTPSMWAIADAADALNWIEEIGGSAKAMERANANAAALQGWVDATDWVENLVPNAAERSNTSVCLKIVDPAIAALDDDAQKAFVKKMVKLLDAEDVAYDINGYRDAPAGLRIWCGATVDTADIEALTPWLDHAFAVAKADL